MRIIQLLHLNEINIDANSELLAEEGDFIKHSTELQK
jgi:hypothetical protein